MDLKKKSTYGRCSAFRLPHCGIFLVNVLIGLFLILIFLFFHFFREFLFFLNSPQFFTEGGGGGHFVVVVVVVVAVLFLLLLLLLLLPFFVFVLVFFFLISYRYFGNAATNTNIASQSPSSFSESWWLISLRHTCVSWLFSLARVRLRLIKWQIYVPYHSICI